MKRVAKYLLLSILSMCACFYLDRHPGWPNDFAVFFGAWSIVLFLVALGLAGVRLMEVCSAE